MRMTAWLVGGAVACALSLAAWSNGQAAPPIPKVPKVPKEAQSQVIRQLKLGNPAGTAKAVAALARFANGQLTESSYDQRVARTLGKQPGAQETAKRLIGSVEQMAVTERAKLFPGVAKVESLTTSVFDKIRYDKGLIDSIAQLPSGPDTTVLAPDPVNTKDKAQYELVYRGAQCDRTADADGADESVVYVNVIGRQAGAYTQAPKFLPESGTTLMTGGALTTTGAGPAWTSPTWPGGWSSGIVIVTAVLEDNGDLAQRKQELDLLLQFGLSETEEDTVTQDRMEVLRRELEDALAILHLANPDRWSAKAVQVKKLTSSEYDQLYLKASTASPTPHKLTFQHDPRGAAYTLYFDIPAPVVKYKTAYLTIKELEALGPDRDKDENRIADLGVDVAINGNTSAGTTRLFARDRNLVKPSWTVERQVEAGRPVMFELKAFDDNAAPACACASSSGWFGGCTAYCATSEQRAQCYDTLKLINPGIAYAGTCARGKQSYDIHPAPNGGDGWFGYGMESLYFTLDTATNKVAGDAVVGNAGTFTLTGTDGAGNRARVVFEVGTK